MSKKFRRVSYFRKFIKEGSLSKNGQGHPAYVSAVRGDRSRINVLTHSMTFFEKPTMKLHDNPEVGSSYKEISRFSVPSFEKNSDLVKIEGKWSFSKRDQQKVDLFNLRYRETGFYKKRRRKRKK